MHSENNWTAQAQMETARDESEANVGHHAEDDSLPVSRRTRRTNVGRRSPSLAQAGPDFRSIMRPMAVGTLVPCSAVLPVWTRWAGRNATLACAANQKVK